MESISSISHGTAWMVILEEAEIEKKKEEEKEKQLLDYYNNLELEEQNKINKLKEEILGKMFYNHLKLNQNIACFEAIKKYKGENE